MELDLTFRDYYPRNFLLQFYRSLSTLQPAEIATPLQGAVADVLSRHNLKVLTLTLLAGTPENREMGLDILRSQSGERRAVLAQGQSSERAEIAQDLYRRLGKSIIPDIIKSCHVDGVVDVECLHEVKLWLPYRLTHLAGIRLLEHLRDGKSAAVIDEILGEIHCYRASQSKYRLRRLEEWNAPVDYREQMAKWQPGQRFPHNAAGHLLNNRKSEFRELLAPMLDDEKTYLDALRNLLAVSLPEDESRFRRASISSNPTERIYGLGGLASIGDKEAMRKMALIFTLPTPGNDVPSAIGRVAQHLDLSQLIAVWRPVDSSESQPLQLNVLRRLGFEHRIRTWISRRSSRSD
jgi:hypothetical protein